MATIAQFESALLDKGVEIEEMKIRKKDVYLVYGSKDGVNYLWNANGTCMHRLPEEGGAKPELDLKL